MKKKLALMVAVLALALAAAVPAFAAGGNGTVTVIHGVPGLVVDVYVNGALALPNFEPYTVTDPISLPESNYNIIIVPAGGDPANPAISGSVFLPAGANASIIAHLTAAGAPTLSAYVNDLSGIKPGESRLVVRHDAAAPAVDVKLARPGMGGEKSAAVLPNLSNPNQVSADVRPGRYEASLSPAGSDQTAFGPATLKLKPGVVTIVYAVGSIVDGTFTLLTQKIQTR
jgi:hypothetical protein